MEQPQNGKDIVQYLLQELPDEEQQRLDEQLFVDDDYYDNLLATENELIDDYLRNRLSPKQRQSFERTFLRSPYLRKSVNLARSLLTYIDDKARIGMQASLTSPYKILTTGRRQYELCLVISALFRIALLAFLWVLLLRVARTSSVDLQTSSLLFIVLVVAYAGVELLNVLVSLKAANRALAATWLRELTSSER
jgi:hypothetical protein